MDFRHEFEPGARSRCHSSSGTLNCMFQEGLNPTIHSRISVSDSRNLQVLKDSVVVLGSHTTAWREGGRPWRQKGDTSGTLGVSKGTTWAGSNTSFPALEQNKFGPLSHTKLEATLDSGPYTTSSYTDPNPSSRWISTEEWAERQQRGLCFPCGEQGNPNHSCKFRLQQLVLLGEDDAIFDDEKGREVDSHPPSDLEIAVTMVAKQPPPPKPPEQILLNKTENVQVRVALGLSCMLAFHLWEPPKPPDPWLPSIVTTTATTTAGQKNLRGEKKVGEGVHGLWRMLDKPPLPPKPPELAECLLTGGRPTVINQVEGRTETVAAFLFFGSFANSLRKEEQAEALVRHGYSVFTLVGQAHSKCQMGWCCSVPNWNFLKLMDKACMMGEKCWELVEGNLMREEMGQAHIWHMNDFKISIEDLTANSLPWVAIAYRLYVMEKIPDSEELARWSSLEDGLILLAIVVLKDPCLPGVKDAVELSKKAGVKVKMVTGDNVKILTAIAVKSGILDSLAAVTEPAIIEGTIFCVMLDANSKKIADRISDMGQSSPNDKLLLVQALRKMGNVVVGATTTVGNLTSTLGPPNLLFRGEDSRSRQYGAGYVTSFLKRLKCQSDTSRGDSSDGIMAILMFWDPGGYFYYTTISYSSGFMIWDPGGSLHHHYGFYFFYTSP